MFSTSQQQVRAHYHDIDRKNIFVLTFVKYSTAFCLFAGLLQMPILSECIDLTQETAETQTPARAGTPFSNASLCSDDQLMRCADLIDLTTDSGDQPGPSFSDPPRKRRNVSYSTQIVAPKTAQNNGKYYIYYY